MFLFFFLARFPFSLVLLILRGGGRRSFSRPRKRYASSTHQNHCKKNMSEFVSVFHSAATWIEKWTGKKGRGSYLRLRDFLAAHTGQSSQPVVDANAQLVATVAAVLSSG